MQAAGAAADGGFRFTNDWFGTTRGIWESLLPQVAPRRILEVGCFEGRSTCFTIEHAAKLAPIEIHCVDPWLDEPIYKSVGADDMGVVEARFRHNTAIAVARAPHKVDLVVHKAPSDATLSRMLAGGMRNGFDFIYIDGSHHAADVLCDAVLAFRLLRIGGTMAFDDYLWSEDLPDGRDLLRCPKPAIDAFVNLNVRKLQLLNAPLFQLYVTKTSD
jgi:SAM-dependent methyltransferase